MKHSTVADLRNGALFELVVGHFHKVPGLGQTRRVRCHMGNDDGRVTITTTYCGETYTLKETTPVIIHEEGSK